MSWPQLGYSAPSLVERKDGKPRANLVLKGGLIVNVRKRKIEKRDLYICQGIIVDERVGKKCGPKTIIDVSKKWLIPGLNDMHVHARGQLFGNDNWQSLSPRMVAKIFAKTGVIHFLDAMQDESIIFPSREAQRHKPNPHEADILCAGGAFTPTGGHGFEYLSQGVAKTALHVVDTPQQAVAEVNAIALKRPDVVKIMYDHRGMDAHGNTITIKDGEIGVLGRAMRKDVMKAIVKRCKEMGLRPYVHIGMWDDAKDALKAGAIIINHLGEGVIPDDLLRLIGQKKIYWIPTLVLQGDFINIKNNQRLLRDELLARVASPALINSYKISNYFNNGRYKTDNLLYTAKYQKKHLRSDPVTIKKLFKAGATLVTGSDAPERGSFIGWSVHREMALLVSYGLTPWDALAAATINAGDLLGLNYGLEIGAEGNVVILNSSPIADIWNTTKIHQVIHHGVIIHTYP